MKFGSLFSGIGGFDLGLERAGMECAWQVEINPKSRAVLRRHWPGVPLHEDVTKVGRNELGAVDLICGGFPCQDISSARNRYSPRGIDGEQSGLWRAFRRIVEELCPRWVVVENVGVRSRWLPDVRSDLSGLGYASVPVELPACSVGATHIRRRIFVVASNSDRHRESVVRIHAEVARMRPLPVPHGHWREAPSGGFRVDDGVPGGVDRRRLLGNAVVPQVARWLGARIIREAGRV